MRHPHFTNIQLFTLAMCLVCKMAFAQTCTIINLDTIICQGTTVAFSLNTTGGAITSYAWNFGNGFTANTASPAHTYTSAGNFTPTVTIKFLGGATCTATGSLIKVRATPIANFNITTPRTMCFKGNELCIEDISVPGVSLAPIKRRAYQLSNGYIQLDSPPYTSKICYKNTVDFVGHLYTLVLEVTDTNNCVGKLQKKDSVLLYPKFERLSYTVDSTIYCHKTEVQFTNTSLLPFSRVKSFRWVFGDGSEDQSNWQVAKHDYTYEGVFAPLLIVTDTQNCIDTLYGDSISITLFRPDSTLYNLNPTTQCYRKNGFGFTSKNDDANYAWKVYDENGTVVMDSSLINLNSFLFQANSCGLYTVSLTVQKGNCIFRTDSMVRVLGPKAIIEDPMNRVVHGHQCTIKDTVYFKTPVPFLSCINYDGYGMKYLWNFDDPFAPACTLDTRNGLNIVMNCNFSVDSMVVNHFYTPGKEGCYKPKLTIVDTVLGCWDTDSIQLPLMKPIASKDLSAMPPREGLRLVYPGPKCLGEEIAFAINSCDYRVAYIYRDSLCDTCNWEIVDSLNSHVYDTTYDSDGFVTVGLIIGNGDGAGNFCYDTAWYHHLLQLSPINPEFTVEISPDCGPYRVRLVPKDTIQYLINQVTWQVTSMLDPSFNDISVQVFSPTDSIVETKNMLIPNPGTFGIVVLFESVKGCRKRVLNRFSLGNIPDFGTLQSVDCVDDSIGFFSNIFYYDANVVGGINYFRPYWQMPQRAAAGKETVWWDKGDGNGFTLTGGSVNAKYDQAGRYTITMVSQDSIGCKDTLVKNQLVTISDIHAYIQQLNQQYYCAPQIISFVDSSIVFDTIPILSPSILDSTVLWSWDFGDQTVLGSLKNSSHNYTRNGVYDVRLIATTLTGCTDTAFASVTINGPTPTFNIVDTMGCEPFTAIFENTTGKPLKSWTWYFGDSANQTLTSLTDSTVTFTYTKPGVYSIRLLGSQDVTNPTTGNTTNCNSFFPDPITQLPERKVYVLPIAPVRFELLDSICRGEEVRFIPESDTSYTQFEWSINTGDRFLMNTTDTFINYTFDSAGLFRVTLVPLQNPITECWDSASKDIRVLQVLANFEVDSSEAPHYFFTNTSIAATDYVWNFGKPKAGASNEKTTVNADFDYGKDTASYEVCLFAFDPLGCRDSICKPIRIRQLRLVIPNVFTPDNNDGYNDAFDIDILGFTEYHLTIYNRWGTEVFEGFADGYRNDGINWNGNDHQTGPPCADGVYYFIFTYKFYTESEPHSVHGTITLMRNN
jgi:gliding motility-associated-like protein